MEFGKKQKNLRLRWLGAALMSAPWVVACVPDRTANDASSAKADDRVDVSSSSVPAASGAAGAPPTQLSPERAPAASHGTSGPSLDRARLVREVIARNPDVEARRAAWRAAKSRGRQVDTWDDPMLGYEFAPLSIFSGMRFGQTVRLSQRIPWPGKRSSAEEAEDRAAQASAEEIKVTALDLALDASQLYDDYWLVERSTEVNAEHQRLLEELKRSAEIQYSVGRASLSDPLEADVELAMLAEQDLGLASRRDVVVAELNALLHRSPESKLPRPPAAIPVETSDPPASAELQRQALVASPELRKLAAKSRSAQARIRRAEREYYPDVTLMASYSSMFPELAHQFMVGFETPLPIQRGSRAGAVDEASAMAAEVRADAARVVDAIRSRVDAGRRRVVEAIQVVKLYDTRLIPTARTRVEATRADFGAGRTDFSAVIGAEKSLRNFQLARYMAAAELSKRRAELDRAVGRMPHGIDPGGKR